MDHLPIELYRCIFRYLSIDDLFNCRLVNKKFKCSTYECINRLVIGESNRNIKDHFWFNNEPINNNELISLERFSRIRSIFNLDNYLKCLKIWLQYDFDDDNDFTCDYICEKLWTFDNLINLECFDIFFQREDFNFNFNLNLKNLKYFKSYCSYIRTYAKFELNTPKLERIETDDMESICIKSDPKSIKHLIIPFDNYNSFDLQKQFKNLEIIHYTDFHGNFIYLHAEDPYIDIQILNKNNLSYFNNLKQLKFSFPIYSSYVDKIYRIFEKNFDKKFNDLKKLKREIDIYFQGIKIMNIQKLTEFKSSKNILEYQLNNIDLFDSPQNYDCFYYCELNNFYNNLRNDLPSNFFDKYQNLTYVYIDQQNKDKLIDADNLNWFLNNLKCLKKLNITLPLDQKIFNNLPNLPIRCLNIFRIDCHLNLNFILKFSELIWFNITTKHDLFDLALESFSKLKYLKEFQFFNQIIRIQRIGKQFRFVRENVGGLSEEELKSSLLNYDQFVQELYERKLILFHS